MALGRLKTTDVGYVLVYMCFYVGLITLFPHLLIWFELYPDVGKGHLLLGICEISRPPQGLDPDKGFLLMIKFRTGTH